MAATQDVGVVEVLNLLQDQAKHGVRAFIIIGKVKGVRDSKPNAAGVVHTYADIICGEGDTMGIEMSARVIRPAAGDSGAFLVSPRYFKGDIQGFTCTECVCS